MYDNPPYPVRLPVTPPPPPAPFDPRTLPYCQVRNRVHWTTVVARGSTIIILLIPFVILLLDCHEGRSMLRA